MLLKRKISKVVTGVAITLLAGLCGACGYFAVDGNIKYKNQQEITIEKNKENASLKAEITQLEQDKNVLEDQKETIQEEKFVLEEQIETLEEEQEMLQASYEALEISAAAEKARLQEAIAAIQLEKAELQTRYEDLEDQKDAIQEEKFVLEEQIETLEEEQEMLQASYESLENSAAAEKAELQGVIAEIQAEKGQLLSDYNALQVKEAQLQGQIEDLQQEIENLKQGSGSSTTVKPTEANRIVLMIGDSLSEENIASTEARAREELYISGFSKSGTVQLDVGANAEDSFVDLVQSAKDKGLGLAFVTNDVLYEDSAKRFTAPNSTGVSNIIAEQIASDFNLIFGVDYHDGSAYTYASQEASIEAAGFTFINNINFTTINKYSKGELSSGYVLEDDKLFGAFQGSDLSQFTATQNDSKENYRPCLGQMTEVAIEFMDINYPSGYLLIVENNQMGELEGQNDLDMAKSIVEFDRCARIVRKSFRDNNVDYNLIVTGSEYTSSPVPYFVDGVECALTSDATAEGITTFAANSMKKANSKIEKVVMVVGDGMGIAHMGMTRNFLDDGEYLNVDKFKYSGQATTDSLSVIEGKSSTPDSAAGGTALATGVRVYNGAIGMQLTAHGATEGTALESIAEVYKQKGMGVGIISTDCLFEATPAAFYAHTYSRYNYVDIRTQQYASNFDLFLGADMHSNKLVADPDGFYTEYKEPTTPPEGYVAPELTTGYVYQLEQQKIKDAGYTFITDMGTGKVDMNANKLFGAFPSISGTLFEAPLESAELNTAPSFSQMVALAIEWMELHYGDKGYFLMIEENNIDVRSEQHTGNRYNTGDVVESVLELDRAVGVAQDMLNQTGDNYAIVVSADHATGTLMMSDSRYENYGFWSSWHDTYKIPFYIDVKMEGYQKLNVPEELYKDNVFEPILNTQVYDFVKYLADMV